MKTRAKFFRESFHLCGFVIFLAATAIATAPDPASLMRVTTWNLQPGGRTYTNGWTDKFQQNLIREAGDTLKKLDPDVIILQRARDWNTCRQLAQALQPQVYQVVICSSFRDASNGILNGQLAILSKSKSYISWSEPWASVSNSPSSPGGFAFTTIRKGNKTIGIFAVEMGDAGTVPENYWGEKAQRAREESARQLGKQMALLENWKMNRPDAYIMAGDFNNTADDARSAGEKTFSILKQMGFESVFAGLPLEKRVTLPGNSEREDATQDYIFTKGTRASSQPVSTPATLTEHSTLTCEVDVNSSKQIVAMPQPARAEIVQGQIGASQFKANGVQVAATEPETTAPRLRIIWRVGGIFEGAAALFFIVQLINRVRPNRAVKAKPSVSPAGFIAEKNLSAPENSIRTQSQSQTWHGREELKTSSSMPEELRAGVIAQLSSWIRQQFLQRLISDRRQLVAAQEAAVLKVLAVDARLTRIERQIQQQNEEYETRISELERELLDAHEENRELIRAKIAMVKAEMQKALPNKRLNDHQRN